MEQLRVQRIAAFYELDEFDFDVLGGLTQALGAVGTHPRQRGRPGRGTRGGGGRTAGVVSWPQIQSQQ